MTQYLEVEFGALGVLPIREQLMKQGYPISDRDSEIIQELADQIINLKLYHILTSSAVESAQKKLLKMISKAVIEYKKV